MRSTLLLICILLSIWSFVWCSKKISPLEDVLDAKHFKQLLRTRTNVLVLFMKSKSSASSILLIFKEAASQVRGLGTFLTVDCSGKGQKLCRQQKADPDPHVLHHYKDGKFHKVYDRQETTKSIMRFMQDPTGDVPWEEDPSGKDVVHLDNPKKLEKLLKKHKTALVMFYAPWCVYCKQMKPEYAAAATIVRSNNLGILAAIDVVRPENAATRSKYNITGFPTVYLFKNGEIETTYEGENKQDKIVEFMKNPQAAPVKAIDVPWSEEDSDVHHLMTDNFDETIKENPSTLVMFYAPWCGHCKKLKPEWKKAASIVHSQKSGIIAALDATKEPTVAQRFEVKGYPTIKYFKDGKFAFDTPTLRDAKKIVDFMEDPKEPPPPPPPEPNWADVPSEVIHLDDQNFKTHLRSKRHALIMFYAPWCGHCKAAKPEFESAAEKLKEEPRIVIGAVNCVENAQLCKTHDVQGYPTFKYFKYFKESSNYDGGRKTADFINFFEKLEPSLVKGFQLDSPTSKSLPPNVPKATKKNGESSSGSEKIFQVTDKNYKTMLSEHERLLILFHSKTCGPCKDMKNVLTELGNNLDPDMGVFAACDIESSPKVVSAFEIKSLPTLKFFRGGQFITNYSGEATVADLKKFLNKVNTFKDEL